MACSSFYLTTLINISDTIISSFPRRWGRNKPDYSGVHKGIRSILDHPREGQIQSVYDLALLIINQCSTVFFDRTKPVDERPELLDIFSNALSDIVSDARNHCESTSLFCCLFPIPFRSYAEILFLTLPSQG